MFMTAVHWKLLLHPHSQLLLFGATSEGPAHEKQLAFLFLQSGRKCLSDISLEQCRYESSPFLVTSILSCLTAFSSSDRILVQCHKFALQDSLKYFVVQFVCTVCWVLTLVATNYENCGCGCKALDGRTSSDVMSRNFPCDRISWHISSTSTTLIENNTEVLDMYTFRCW